MVNYRGSIGSGQESVEFLLGRIGDSDVKDVHLATFQALKKFPFLNPKKMVLFGGSHGGFLVTHLSGQFPVMSFENTGRSSNMSLTKHYQIQGLVSFCILLIHIYFALIITCPGSLTHYRKSFIDGNLKIE
jgi:acylaminoacyl-peptidase